MIKELTIQTFNFVLIIFSDEMILGPQRIRLPTVDVTNIFFGRFKRDRDFRFVRESGVGVMVCRKKKQLAVNHLILQNNSL